MRRKTNNSTTHLLSSTERTQSGRVILTLPMRIIALVIILAVIGTVVYFLVILPKQGTGTTSDTSKTATEIRNSKVLATTSEATKAAYSQGGSTEKAVAVYDKAISDADNSDKETQGALYHDKAQLLLNATEKDAALEAALKAVELTPNAANYGILGRIYEVKGDKTNAIAAYEKALTYVTATPDKSSDNGGEGAAGDTATRNYYEQRVAELKAGS